MSPDGKAEIILRHTVNRAQLKREQRVSEGNTVIIYVDRRGHMYTADRALTAGEIWFDAPKVMYEVDTGVHHDTFSLELPSSDGAFFFHAAVEVSWQVKEPKKLVEARLDVRDDIESVYRPLMRQELRRLSRRFDVEDSAAAEEAINSEFVCERLPLPHGLAMLTCSVTLSLDRGTQAHIAERTLHKRAKASREQKHEVKLAEAGFTVLEEDAAHQVERLRRKKEQELERMREEHRIALQTMRMEFYDQALQDERFGLIKLRLDQSPDDIDGVIELLARHRQVPWEEARAFLATAIDGGLVGPKHVAGLVYQAAATLTEGMREGGLRPENRQELIQKPADPADPADEPAARRQGRDDNRHRDAGPDSADKAGQPGPVDGKKGDQDEYPV